MKTEAQRIAIARACGEDNDSIVRELIPDYLNSLDAMHEAEQFIRRDYDVYGLYLSHLNRTAPECRVHATAAQKAEAFLKAVGKWEGGK